MGIFEDFKQFVTKDEEQNTHKLSYIFLFWGMAVLISLQTTTAPYGRYFRAGWGFMVPVKFAWIVQELPSFVVPVCVLYFTDCPKSQSVLNMLALGLFLLHYFQRTFIFPMLIRGGKPTPLIPFVMAIAFCLLNGWLQSTHLLKFNSFDESAVGMARAGIGTVLFLMGMFVNIHSDSILRNLRKPGETGYKIPKGGMFEFVSGANFFGEVLEWWGFAVLCWSLPAFAFAFFTLFNIGPRACQHHRFYKEKFDDYPKNRKALIPYIL